MALTVIVGELLHTIGVTTVRTLLILCHLMITWNLSGCIACSGWGMGSAFTDVKTFLVLGNPWMKLCLQVGKVCGSLTIGALSMLMCSGWTFIVMSS